MVILIVPNYRSDKNIGLDCQMWHRLLFCTRQLSSKQNSKVFCSMMLPMIWSTFVRSQWLRYQTVSLNYPAQPGYHIRFDTRLKECRKREEMYDFTRRIIGRGAKVADDNTIR